MPEPGRGARRWAMVAMGAQFAALLRILGEYFRLRGLQGSQLPLRQVDPWIAAALLTATLIAAATGAVFFGRYRLTVAIGLATILLLLLFKGYLVSTGRLPGWS